jgi:hypothetical protein
MISSTPPTTASAIAWLVEALERIEDGTRDVGELRIIAGDALERWRDRLPLREDKAARLAVDPFTPGDTDTSLALDALDRTILGSAPRIGGTPTP